MKILKQTEIISKDRLEMILKEYFNRTVSHLYYGEPLSLDIPEFEYSFYKPNLGFRNEFENKLKEFIETTVYKGYIRSFSYKGYNSFNGECFFGGVDYELDEDFTEIDQSYIKGLKAIGDEYGYNVNIPTKYFRKIYEDEDK